ncbi:MAG TPA: translocation/assembly module TamB domain-containing protein [Bacteroidales bacterium]|jgi:hypothetical protein|nr:translocation/assembly module TamB domain-containing protein [Bacteroidales bacterium]HQJ82467.1 translocation/assembly module TamB domain-containing protein [Bacteroidales bacterium]
MIRAVNRTIRILLILAGTIIMIPALLYPVLRHPEIQTLIIKRITRHFSQELKSTISVGKTEFIFFNRLSMDDVLIKDKNDDTLLYAKKLSVTIRRINTERNEYTLGSVVIMNPVFSLITDTAGVQNLQWYLALLKRGSGKPAGQPVALKINHADIRNGSFSLINQGTEIRENNTIDFNRLHLGSINGNLREFSVRKDTTSFSVHDLSFRESGGFTVRKMSSDFAVADRNIIFTSANINCDSSILNIPLVELKAGPDGTFGNFINTVNLDIQIDKSLVYTSDLQHFVAAVNGMHENVNIRGRIFGTIAELRGRDISLGSKEETVLDCDFDLSGLPDIMNSFIYLGVHQLKSSAEDIKDIRVPGGKALRLPDYFERLGKISFNGSFTGFTTDFVAYGKLESEAGNLNTDVSFRPEGKNQFKIKGLITGNGINLGEITGNSDLLGDLSIKTDVDMHACSFKTFSGEINGLIDSVEINHYKYRNISLNGIINDKTWDGSIKIADENIRLDMLGMMNFNRELPEFDFTLNLVKADLFRLHLDKSDSTSAASMLLTANFRGKIDENLVGEVKLLNSSLRKYGNTLDMYDFSLRSFMDNNQPSVSLRTDYVDADLKGRFNPAGLMSFIASAKAGLMPSRYVRPELQSPFVTDTLVFAVNFKQTDNINNFFRTGLLLADKSTITGEIVADTAAHAILLSDKLVFRGNTFSDLAVDLDYSRFLLGAGLRSSSLNFLGHSDLEDFSADFTVKPDNFIFSLNWEGNDPRSAGSGSFTARGISMKEAGMGAGPLMLIDIASSDIINPDNQWRINHSTILLDSNMVNINNLLIHNESSYYLIDGTLSKNREDSLRLEFKNIDISPLNSLISGKDDREKLSLDLKGELSGKVLLTDVYSNPLAEGDLRINGFSILGGEYGTLTLNSAWNNEGKVAEIRAGNNLSGKKMLDVKGYYNPQARQLDLTASSEKLPVDALNPLLNSFASDISGSASGKVRISGELNRLVMKGSLMAQNTSMTIDYLQTRYKLNDSVRFDNNKIIFRDLKLSDERGNTAMLNGKVFHNHFKDFNADITVSFNDFMVINTKARDNEDFYGTAFATGIVTIKTGQNLISFDISARTGRNTRFYMPLNTSETLTDYSFVSFVTPGTSGVASDLPGSAATALAQATTGIELNFDLDVTPDAEIQLIFDEKVGDVIRGRGSGNLNINLDQKGNLGISGDYVIDNGDYLFTLGNVMNKPFTVENGGKVSFSGNIDNAEIDLKAIYRLKASLFEILQDDRFNERIPVECQILLSGKLFNPVVGFNIDLPSADEERRAYLRNVITTDEELSRQFLYLLVMNSFYSDPGGRSSVTGGGSATAGTGTTGTSAMAVTTTEMLSHQLSNWLSQISNDFDIGFVYRPGYKDINAQEVEVALSTQLLNDRVTINGNFDVRGAEKAAGTSDKITGDFDIEYKLTEKIRFRFFNRFNNPYTGKGAPYTQGFGLFFRKDFNQFADLFRKTGKSEMKKEDEVMIEGEGPEASR